MAAYCYNFGWLAWGGQPQLEHFPAGTYHAQTRRRLGKVELDMMRLMVRVWSMQRMKASDYKPEDMKFLKWLQPPRGQRCARLNELIRGIWYGN